MEDNTYTILINYGYPRELYGFSNTRIFDAESSTFLFDYLDYPNYRILSRVSKQDRIKFNIPPKAIQIENDYLVKNYDELILIQGDMFRVYTKKKK